MRIGFWWGDLEERDHLAHLDVDERIILKWIFKEGWICMDWLDLAQDRDRWRAFVNTVMKLCVP